MNLKFNKIIAKEIIYFSPAPARIPSRGNGIQKTGRPKTDKSR